MHATQPDTQPLAPTILSAPHSRWWDRLRPYRTAAILILILILLLFSLALVACLHLLTGLDLDALRTSLLLAPKPALLSAMAATAVGFVALLGYEWSASRFAGVKLPASVLAFAGFSALAIGSAVGLSVLSGGSVRYRLHARHGVSAIEVICAGLPTGAGRRGVEPCAGRGRARLPAAKVFCVYGREDADSSGCTPPQAPGEKLALPGGHHFDENYPVLAERLGQAIKARQKASKP